MSESGRWLVLALGNPLQGDDGFGPAVLERLRRDRRVTAHADCVDAGTDLLGHLDRFASYEQVVLVDAWLDDRAPAGEVVVKGHAELAAFAASRTRGAHAPSPVEAVELFRTLDPHSTTRVRWVLLRTGRLRAGSGEPDHPAAATGARIVRELIANSFVQNE